MATNRYLLHWQTLRTFYNDNKEVPFGVTTCKSILQWQWLNIVGFFTKLILLSMFHCSPPDPQSMFYPSWFSSVCSNTLPLTPKVCSPQVDSPQYVPLLSPWPSQYALHNLILLSMFHCSPPDPHCMFYPSWFSSVCSNTLPLTPKVCCSQVDSPQYVPLLSSWPPQYVLPKLIILSMFHYFPIYPGKALHTFVNG